MAKARKPRQRKPIKRVTKHFQLRVDHPIDAHVGEILSYAKGQRREVTVIRDGVRLLWALENNDLSVLFDMFPHLKGQFLPGGVNLIEQIQSMLSKQAIGQGDHKPALGFGPTGKQLTAAHLDMPNFEELDDQPTVIIRASTNTDSSLNFVTALKGLSP